MNLPIFRPSSIVVFTFSILTLIFSQLKFISIVYHLSPQAARASLHPCPAYTYIYIYMSSCRPPCHDHHASASTSLVHHRASIISYLQFVYISHHDIFYRLHFRLYIIPNHLYIRLPYLLSPAAT
jgi:hypothetical protein